MIRRFHKSPSAFTLEQPVLNVRRALFESILNVSCLMARSHTWPLGTEKCFSMNRVNGQVSHAEAKVFKFIFV